MTVLLLVGIGWMYVVVMMSVAEAMAPTGSLLGALATFLLYGVGPLALTLYLLGAPLRRRRRQAQEAAEAREAAARDARPSGDEPDGAGHAAGDPVAPVREEP